MLKTETVELQILPVFRTFHEKHTRGLPVRKAYREAVREVAQRFSVAYQTIEDGCRRRLRLSKIDDLYTLLEQWVCDEPTSLSRKLKEASDRSAHDSIDEFFRSFPSGTTTQRTANTGRGQKFETISFDLAEHDMRKLRALAEYEGISQSELIGELVKAAVSEKMKFLAQSILRESTNSDTKEV